MSLHLLLLSSFAVNFCIFFSLVAFPNIRNFYHLLSNLIIHSVLMAPRLQLHLPGICVSGDKSAFTLFITAPIQYISPLSYHVYHCYSYLYPLLHIRIFHSTCIYNSLLPSLQLSFSHISALIPAGPTTSALSPYVSSFVQSSHFLQLCLRRLHTRSLLLHFGSITHLFPSQQLVP